MERKLTWIHGSRSSGKWTKQERCSNGISAKLRGPMRGVLDGYETDAEQQGNAPLDRRK
jgi:hypothetical protein